MYDPSVNGERLDFGVSGKLYESTVLFYDRQTKSLWSQLTASAVSGPHRGTELRHEPAADTTWGEWRRRHPDTRVLSTNTGHRRPYGRDPYGGPSDALMFPVSHRDRRLRTGALVYGIELNGQAKAYPVDALKQAPRRFRDTVGRRQVLLDNDPPGVRLTVREAGGTEIPTVRVRWFAWAAFHRDTAIYRAGSAPSSRPTR